MIDLDKLREKMRNVPFGNSLFQINSFGEREDSPERRYRHCLLQLSQKLNALEECKFRRKRIEIDIEEIQEKLKTAENFEKRRLEVDLEEKQFGLENELKLIEDAVIEVKGYETILNTLPDFTREQFEVAELGYWRKRLIDDAKREFISSNSISVGTIQSLDGINIGVVRNENGEIVFLEMKETKQLDNSNVVEFPKE